MDTRMFSNIHPSDHDPPSDDTQHVTKPKSYSNFSKLHAHSKNIHCYYCSVTKSCLTLWDLKDCSPPGSSVHGISQARILAWVAISPLRDPWPKDWTPHLLHWPVDSLPLSHQGSSRIFICVLKYIHSVLQESSMNVLGEEQVKILFYAQFLSQLYVQQILRI